MQFNKGAFLLLALCLSCSHIEAKPSLRLLGDLLGTVGNLGGDIVGGLRNATRDGLGIVKDTVDGLLDANLNLLDNVVDVVVELQQSATGAIKENLGNLSNDLTKTIGDLEKQLRGERNLIRRELINNLLNGLNALQDGIGQVDNLIERIGDRVDQELAGGLDLLRDWAEKQLERANNDDNPGCVENLRKQVTDLVSEVTDQLGDTVETFIQELAGLVQSAAPIAKKVQGMVESVSRVLTCNMLLPSCQRELARLGLQAPALLRDVNDLRKDAQALLELGIQSGQEIGAIVGGTVKNVLTCDDN